MVAISLSGSGEGPGWVTAPGYSTEGISRRREFTFLPLGLAGNPVPFGDSIPRGKQSATSDRANDRRPGRVSRT